MFANAPAQTQGIFKRGMKGVYQHCGEQHLHRYLAEFEFKGLAKYLAPLLAPAFKKLGDEAEIGMKRALERL